MAQTKTIVLGCIAIVILIGVIVACVIGGIFMLSLNAHADEAEKQGMEFGKGTDQSGCQTEAFRRLRAALRNHDLLKRREAQLFLYGCFQTCGPTPGFCAAAPPKDEFIPNRRWAQEQCQKEGLGNDDACVSVVMEVSDVCLGKTKHK